MTALAKAYDPKQVEPQWYDRWLERKAFAATRDPAKDPYCILIPPPNVTGMLHMGHILNNTLQDVFIRRARLEGKAALWMPGMDHAGIATQSRVERELRKEGVSRHDLGREAFVDKVWEWKEQYGGIILQQLQKLGASCDWDRTVFTLDDRYARAVLTAFVRLYERGYIYRGKRMVNWCPVSLTALSNEEVIMKPQQGQLYHMRYELVEPSVDADGKPLTHLEIATTRPETIMGDTAVAVNPGDPRYQYLIGKEIYRPFPKEPLPIIGDKAVDMEFGTGVLKVTPAHDPVDFEIGERHDLPVRDVFNPDATLNELAGDPFVGLDRFAARKAAAQELERLGLLVKTEPYENSVGFSERADVPIEPRLSEQWFLRNPRIEEAKRVVEEGIIRFHPKRWEKVYLHWLNNLHDWCISRQLWWGHRIPVWYRKGSDHADPANWHVSVDGPEDPENWEQEEDVLDTWASSNLWPFATFGWPDTDSEQQADLEYWYPTSTLVTGFDIIFFWVSRMIMAGLELYEEDAGERELSEAELSQRIPYRDVYITGLIRDDKGRKMSKSLGNSPDPLDLIDTFGADGLRFGIINIAPSGQDILFSEQRIEIGRNFCNKLWNACRYREMSGPQEDNQSLDAILARHDEGRYGPWDHWILHRLMETMEAIARGFREFEMHQMTHLLHNFFWGDFCDWYLEASKDVLQRAEDPRHGTTLAIVDLVLRESLLLLHPIMPHITEELWHSLGYCEAGSLIQETRILSAEELGDRLADRGHAIDREVAEAIEQVKELITRARALKAEYNVATKRDVTFFYTADEANKATIQANDSTIRRLAGAGALVEREEPPDGAPGGVCLLGTIYLDLASAIDVTAEQERLEKEQAKLDKVIAGAEARLQNKQFLANAPENVVQGARDQLAQTQAKRDEIARLLASLG